MDNRLILAAVIFLALVAAFPTRSWKAQGRLACAGRLLYLG